MSWEKYSYTRVSPCACGVGKVIMIQHLASDDWNRTRDDGTEFEIKCKACQEKYHIAISAEYYLVPNEIEMPARIQQKSFYSFYSSLKEEIACSFTRSTLKNVVADMKTSKYSTRLQTRDSKNAIHIYYRRTKRRNLPEVILCLEEIIANYDTYKWNCEKIKDYRIKEKNTIEQNEAKIKEVVALSFKLIF